MDDGRIETADGGRQNDTHTIRHLAMPVKRMIPSLLLTMCPALGQP